MIRRGLKELSGGLGDAGLLIPIAVALITINGLDATAVFGGVGVLYIGTALYFRVPVPVQPLKAFAASAIALQLDASTIALGAILMAGAMAILSLSGLASRLAARFPTVLVRGVQVSVALLLAKAAIELAEKGNWEGLPAIAPAASLAMAIAACAVLFASRSSSWLPGSVIVLGAGVALGVFVGGLPSGLELGPSTPQLSLPLGGDLGTALTTLVLAQIPLTFGNSIVATNEVEHTYFGDRARRVTPNRLAASIGIGNLFAGIAGGLPVCHGAGGATAHYKMGARTAWATAAAGSLFLILALGFGSSLPLLLMVLAPGALAGMLLFVAVEHALLGSALAHLDDRVIAAGVGIVTLISGNLGIGFLAGVGAMLGRWAWRHGSGRARRPAEA